MTDVAFAIVAEGSSDCNAPASMRTLDASHHALVPDFAAAGSFDSPTLAELLARRYGPEFPSLLDVMIICDGAHAVKRGEEEGSINDLLHVLRTSSESSAASKDRCARARQGLVDRLVRAQTIAAPRMTPDALEVLTAYFTCLRLGEERVPQSALLGLARLASAAARLLGREEIVVVPDAAVAIALMEERLQALVRGWRSEVVGGVV